MLINQMLELSAREVPEKTAMVSESGRVTYGEFDGRANRLARMLLAAGVQRGDAVAILLPPTLDWPIGYFAAVKAGAKAVVLNAMLKPGEFAAQLHDSRSTALITESRFAGALRQVATAGTVPSIVIEIDTPQFEEQVSTMSEDSPCVLMEEDDECTIIYTSGVLGLQKGVIHTHRSLVSVFEIAAVKIEDVRDDVLFGMIPFFHVLGLVVSFGAFFRGATLVLPRRFAPRAILETVAAERVTNLIGVPAMFVALAMVPDEVVNSLDLGCLRRILTAGAKSVPHVMEAFEKKYGLTVTEIYGTTECPIIAMGGMQDRKLGTAGLPVLDFKVVDEDGNPVALGEVGEALCKGNNVMKGYYNEPELTAMVLEDGWFHTGDLVTQDADGYVTYVEKKSFLIVTAAGTKIAPTEVEYVALTHPAIVDVAYVGVWNERGSQVPTLFVVLKPKKELSKPELRAFCARSVADYKLPQRIEFMAELPRIASGKIDRKTLMESGTAATAA
ncbi:MAG: AMP-binding protein [Dehalococcoidia bacterium]|nr:AMP-binding protein [Dehalococcoidia bacterium]